MVSRSLGILFLVIVLATASLSPVADAQQPGPSSSPPATATPSGNGGPRPLTFDTSISGIATYGAGSDQGTSFNLPLVRSDSTYDTIIHVVNASSAQTPVTITLYDQSGAAQTPFNSPPLAGWASLDYDVQTQFATGFNGSATVTSSSGPIVVTGEVLNSAAADNVDSYNEVPGVSTVPSNGVNIAYLPLLPTCSRSWQNCSEASDTPTLYLHNNSSAQPPVDATVNFYWTNPPSGQPSPTPIATTVSQIPPNGVSDLVVNSVPGIIATDNNFDAAAKISSAQPLAVAVDENGNRAGYWAAAPTPSETGSTFYVPRFEYGTGWTTGIVMLNVDSKPQTFTVLVYYQNGQLALQMQLPNVPSMAIAKFNYAGVNQTLNLPQGFVGSAVVTSPASAVGWFAKYNVPAFAGAVYFAPTSPPAGTTVVVPALRKNAVVIGRSPYPTASTGLSIQNPTASAATYTISFRKPDGTLVYSENVNFPPHAMWYVSQATDTQLPAGFSGSAQIVNASGGVLPIVTAEVDGGSYTPPATLPIPRQFQIFVPYLSKPN